MNIPLHEYWKLLVDYLRPLRGRVVVLLGLLLTGIVLQLINPQLMRYVIDTALGGGSVEGVTAAALMFLLLAFIQQMLGILSTYFSETVAWSATNSLRQDLAEHALSLDQAYHNAHTPGELIERIDGDITILSNFFSQFLIQLVANGLLLIGVILLFARENWLVCLVFTLFIVFALVTLSRLRNVAVPHFKALREASGELYGFIEERLAATQDIRANGAVPYVMRRFYEIACKILARQLKAGLMSNLMVNSAFILFAIGNAAALAVGAYLYQRGQASLGTLYLVFYYANLINRPIEVISQQLQDLQQASASISRVKDLLHVQPTLAEGAIDVLPGGPLSVEFDSVTFGYESEAAVLHDLSFSLAAGRVLGLLGHTGSGKTTIAKLLVRLYDPQSGVICIGEEKMRNLRFETLRRGVSMVTQTVQLFHATVRDNLTLFDQTIPDTAILAVLDDLGLGTWLGTLEHGLDTELASGGSGLSAGEAQLLAFARIFLRKPGLVILDEASSRLDPFTEQLVERALDKLRQGRTLIIIAHRLSTVVRADEILILQNGEILEHGNRTELMEDTTSKFANLLRIGLEEVLA